MNLYDSSNFCFGFLLYHGGGRNILNLLPALLTSLFTGIIITYRVRKNLRQHVGDIDAGAVPCGFGRAIGNKVCILDPSTSGICLKGLKPIRDTDGMTKYNAYIHICFQLSREE